MSEDEVARLRDAAQAVYDRFSRLAGGEFMQDDIEELGAALSGVPEGAASEETRLATWIRDGFTHPDRPLDDGFEIYASALDIAREIIAQRDAAPQPVPEDET